MARRCVLGGPPCRRPTRGALRSNPYGPPPFPQQPVAPSTRQQYPTPAPGQAWNQAPYAPQAIPPRQRNGLAVAAIAISVVALLASIGAVVFIAAGTFAGGPAALTGTVQPVGAAVTGDELVSRLTKVIEDDGGSVGEITCPASSAVGQGLVTVCHGSVDDFDWTGVVVFEDASGTFTLQEL